MRVSIYLDTRQTRKGEAAPLKVAIRRKGESAFIPVGVKILPQNWNIKTHKATGPNAMRVNMVANKRKLEVEKALLGLIESGEAAGITMLQLRDKILLALDPELAERQARQRTFLARFTRYMDMQQNKGTKGLYAFTLRKLQQFDRKLAVRSFEDLTRDYLKDFENYCAQTEKKNTRNIHLRNIRTVFNDAIDSGITNVYPFRKYALSPEATIKKALTVEQLRTLAKYPCEPAQVQYRDIFMLMFYLRGINIGDLLQAKHSDVIDGRLLYRRSKVGTLFSVKLEPEALTIIDRYKGEGWLLSPLDRYKSYLDYLHHLNAALKGIGRPDTEHPGFFPDLSSNWARHSWATAASALDIPKEVISKSLGHSFGLSVTDIYIDFDSRKVDEANRKVIDYICYGKKEPELAAPAPGISPTP